MKKGEAEAAMPTLFDKWANETGQKLPPDGDHQYSFIHFWSWLQDHYHAYTQFRAVADARNVTEMWFDRHFKQAWRN
jgi:hypothetical protein